MKKIAPGNSVLTVKPNTTSSELFTYNANASKKELEKSSFYKSISFVIILGQCFGLMPVDGIKSGDASRIHFRWFSWKIPYTIFNLIGALTVSCLSFIQFLKNGNHFKDLVDWVFFSSSFIGILIFIRISYIWFDLNKKWIIMENFMQKYPFQPNIRRRFQLTTGILMFLAFGEHIMAEINNVNKVHMCVSENTNSVKAYFVVSFIDTFRVIRFHVAIGVFMEISTVLATFAWNFADLFIILLCSAVAERFRQLNKVVQNTEEKNERFWKQIREDYTGLSIMCKAVDDAICHLISLSFGNNLFFICIQLFHTLDHLNGFVSSAYFVCSFGILLIRTLALCIYCCWINDESKVILGNLFEVPSEDFGTETSRFIQQISYSPVAISGSKYFYVTRGLCLQVAGAIITFELILVQLSPALSKDNTESYNTSCDMLKGLNTL